MSKTPSLEEVISQAIDEAQVAMNTCLPCIVDSYDPSTQEVSVKIGLMRKYDDGTVVERPVIPNVRVKFPKGKNFSFSHPIAKGDDGMLIFVQRSLERWRVSSGGVVDPKDSRKFHLSDCFYIPMASRDSDLISGVDAAKTRLVNDKSILELDESGTILIKNDTASVEVNTSGDIKIKNEVAEADLNASGLVEIKNENSTIRMTAAGKFKLQGASGKELLDIIDRFLLAMQGAQVLTAFGLQNFWPPTPTTLTQIKADLNLIKE